MQKSRKKISSRTTSSKKNRSSKRSSINLTKILIGIVILILFTLIALSSFTQRSRASDAGSSIGQLVKAFILAITGGTDPQALCDTLRNKGVSEADIKAAAEQAGIDCGSNTGSTGDYQGGGGGDVADVKQLISSYSLPEPDENEAKTLVAQLKGSTQKGWGATQLLNAERDCGDKCLRYLVTAWIWIEGGSGFPDPYSQNCHDIDSFDRRTSVHEPCLKGTSYPNQNSSLFQVAGFQAYSKFDADFKTVYQWFYKPEDVKPIMEAVISNSDKAGRDSEKYVVSGGLVDTFLSGGKLPADKQFSLDSNVGPACDPNTNEECHFYTVLLSKDPRMAVGLNSIGSGVTKGDLVKCFETIKSGSNCYGSASYNDAFAQKFSNYIAALWMFDNNKEDLTPITGGGPSGNGDGSWPYFCQMWQEWKDDTTFDLSGSGCGPTSMAMTFCKHNGFGNNDKMSCANLPPKVADSLISRGGLTEGTGTSWGPAQKFIKDSVEAGGLGLQMSPSLVTKYVCDPSNYAARKDSANWGNIDLDTMKQHLDQGRTILASSCYIECKGCRTQGLRVSHVFTVDAVDVANRQVHLRDPNNCNPTSGEENMSKAWTSADSFPWNVAWAVYK